MNKLNRSHSQKNSHFKKISKNFFKNPFRFSSVFLCALFFGGMLAWSVIQKPQNLNPEISADDIKYIINHLASENMEGRLTGTPGEKKATQFVFDTFELIGLHPEFDPFEFNGRVHLGKNNHLENFTLEQEWNPLTFSRSGVIETNEIVFAGYGVILPETDHFEAYNSYKDLSVDGKWVLVMRGTPKQWTQERKEYAFPFSTLRYKAKIAEEHGAKGLIFVQGPLDQYPHPVIPFDESTSPEPLETFCISINLEIVNEWFKEKKLSFENIQTNLDRGESFSAISFQKNLNGAIELIRAKDHGRNVIARLKANPDLKRGTLVIGAHADHLGHGEWGNSRAKDDEKGQIHYGADDNASGVAGILELAHYFFDLNQKNPGMLKWDMVFATWSGEELGLLGSESWIKKQKGGNPHQSIYPEVSAYFNLDMVGRLREELLVQGIGSSLTLKELSEKTYQGSYKLSFVKDPYLPTDAMGFYLAGVPTIAFFTGVHDEYHTPRDTVEKINFEGTQDITAYIGRIISKVLAMDQAPDYIEVPRSGGGRKGFRVYLGTIPDYAYEGVGLRLTGVQKDSPAEKAGLQSDDILIQVAGKKINDIYDYTAILSTLEPYIEIEVKLLREDSGVRKEIALRLKPLPRDGA